MASVRELSDIMILSKNEIEKGIFTGLKYSFKQFDKGRIAYIMTWRVYGNGYWAEIMRYKNGNHTSFTRTQEQYLRLKGWALWNDGEARVFFDTTEEIEV
jgi:hypothetical protein